MRDHFLISVALCSEFVKDPDNLFAKLGLFS